VLGGAGREREGIGSKLTRLSCSRNDERCVLNQIRSQVLWSGEASSIKGPLDQQRARSFDREINVVFAAYEAYPSEKSFSMDA
jgi:hypothetical protein